MIRGRQGFSLMETMVSVAVLVTVSAVVVPSLNDALDSMRVSEAVSSLENWEEAVAAFKRDALPGGALSVNRYPANLAQLSSRIVESVDRDICGNLYPSGLASKWSGPYIQTLVSQTSQVVPISIGELRNAYGYEKASEHIILYLQNVRLKDAASLNDMMDGDLDRSGSPPYLVNTTGRVRWRANNTSDLVLVEFRTAGPKCN